MKLTPLNAALIALALLSSGQAAVAQLTSPPTIITLPTAPRPGQPARPVCAGARGV